MHFKILLIEVLFCLEDIPDYLEHVDGEVGVVRVDAFRLQDEQGFELFEDVAEGGGGLGVDGLQEGRHLLVVLLLEDGLGHLHCLASPLLPHHTVNYY
jgi:hypothetical protein